MNPNVGPLRIIDGTVKLPNNVLNWTSVSKDSRGIKLHVRIVVASADSVLPEKMIPSTGNVADSDAVNQIIDADGALYVRDLGYAYKTKMGGWMERKKGPISCSSQVEFQNGDIENIYTDTSKCKKE